MKTVKSELLGELTRLLVLAFLKKALKKVILSKPDATDEIKSVITPKEISGNSVLQIETFSKDNKAYHTNIRADFEKELTVVLSKYSQINLITTAGDCQYMRAKSGKESLLGSKKIENKLSGGDFSLVESNSNNKAKSYILSGDEDFLKKLGVSDQNGRIRDKMQSKFRQIGRASCRERVLR